MKQRVFFACLLSLFACVLFSPVHAAKVEKMENVVIDESFPLGPTKIEIEAEPGEVITRTIFVDNRFGKEKGFFLEIEDFQGSPDNPEQSVVLQGQGEGSYTAKDWIKPEFMEFTSNHGERTHFNVVITIPENADAGDHYASVLVSAEMEKEEGSEAENTKPTINIRSRVGTLFFMRIKGDVTEQGAMETFEVNKEYFERGPVVFRSVFRNEGTVRLQPYGEIVVTNMFGGTVENIEVETYNVLRNSVRAMTYSWQPQGFLIGKHTAVMHLYNTYDEAPQEMSVEFWIIPWKHILAVLAVIIIFIFILRFMRRNLEVKVKKK